MADKIFNYLNGKSLKNCKFIMKQSKNKFTLDLNKPDELNDDKGL